MPASGGRVAFGIDQVDADAARSELIEWVNASKLEYLHDSFDEPFMNIPLDVKAIVRKYLKRGDTKPIADTLQIPAEEVDLDRLWKPSFVIYVNTKEKPKNMRLAGVQALAILALGELSYDHGLPAVGRPPVVPERLRSGFAMHISAETLQTYKGEVGGFALLMLWK